MQTHDVRVLKGAAIPTAVVGAVVVVVAGLVAGGGGALGAALGVLLVAAFFTLGLLAVSLAGRISPQMMMIAALGGYIVKLLAIAMVLSAFRDATAWNPQALAWSVIVCTLVWTAGEARAFLKLRMLYVEPGVTVPGLPKDQR
jgi:ATP synthase protein I